MGKLNFNLPSADDLFSTQEEREESKNKRVIRDIPISDRSEERRVGKECL